MIHAQFKPLTGPAALPVNAIDDFSPAGLNGTGR